MQFNLGRLQLGRNRIPRKEGLPMPICIAEQNASRGQKRHICACARAGTKCVRCLRVAAFFSQQQAGSTFACKCMHQSAGNGYKQTLTQTECLCNLLFTDTFSDRVSEQCHPPEIASFCVIQNRGTERFCTETYFFPFRIVILYQLGAHTYFSHIVSIIIAAFGKIGTFHSGKRIDVLRAYV